MFLILIGGACILGALARELKIRESRRRNSLKFRVLKNLDTLCESSTTNLSQEDSEKDATSYSIERKIRKNSYVAKYFSQNCTRTSRVKSSQKESQRGSDYAYLENDCVICLERLDNRKHGLCRILPCYHAFHKDCIDEWVVFRAKEYLDPRNFAPFLGTFKPNSQMPSCPLCKLPLNVISDIDLRVAMARAMNIKADHHFWSMLQLPNNPNNEVNLLGTHRINNFIQNNRLERPAHDWSSLFG